MGKIFHLDLTGLAYPQPVRKTKAMLESGHQGPMTIGLDNETSTINVAAYLHSLGLKTQVYHQGDQWLVLMGQAPDSPDILVWFGPNGWQTAVDEPGALERPVEDDHIIDLVQPVDLHTDELAVLPESGFTSNWKTGRADLETVVLAGSHFMGYGDQTLGAKLAVSFFDSLAAMNRPPGTIVFYNTGVLLTTQDSSTIDALHELEIQGATVVSCQASLEFLGISKDRLQAGRSADMQEIINIQRLAGRTIRL